MRILASLLVLLAAGVAAADADSEYADLLDAWKGKRYADALSRAEAFRAANPGHRHAAAVLYMGGDAAAKTGEWAKAEEWFRALLRDHPSYKKADDARDGIVTALRGRRRLDACIAACEEYLKADPASPHVPHWVFTRGESLFRLFRFAEAKEALAVLAAGAEGAPYAAAAKGVLAKIDPDFAVDAAGVVDDYRGKYVGDIRLAAARASVPGLVAGARTALAERLGLAVPDPPGVLVRFEDTTAAAAKRGDRGSTYTVGIGGRPVEVMVFYTEFVVLWPQDFGERLVHEVKHAVMRGAMGQAYLDLPRWIREGLAMHAAGQAEGRAAQIVSNAVFAGQDPTKIVDALDSPRRDYDDYLVDGLAVEWLAGRRPGAVKDFTARLLRGEAPEAAFAAAAGLPFEQAREQAEEHCATWVLAALGAPYDEYRALAREGADAAKKGDAAAAEWVAADGGARWKRWIEANPDHVLAPLGRYRYGKALVLAGRHEEGRALLRHVVDQDSMRSTICDDAACWIARSFEKEGDAARAAEAFGVLLRDYSWSKTTEEFAGRYAPAGPVLR